MTPIDCARRFYGAVACHDLAGVLACLRPHLHWTEAEGFPYFSGTWTSPEEVVEKLFVPLARDWDDFAVVPAEFLADGDVVVTFGTYRGASKATGKPMRAPFAQEVKDAKLARFDMYTDTLLIDRAMR